jgi:hypothetical protein
MFISSSHRLSMLTHTYMTALQRNHQGYVSFKEDSNSCGSVIGMVGGSFSWSISMAPAVNLPLPRLMLSKLPGWTKEDDMPTTLLHPEILSVDTYTEPPSTWPKEMMHDPYHPRSELHPPICLGHTVTGSLVMANMQFMSTQPSPRRRKLILFVYPIIRR